MFTRIYFSFDYNTPLLSPTSLDIVGDNILLLYLLFDLLVFLCVIHSNICLLYT